MVGVDFEGAPKAMKNGFEGGVVISVLTRHSQGFVGGIERKKHKAKRKKVFSYFFKAHTGSLLLVLAAYTTIIFIACTILVLAVFSLENSTDNNGFYVYNKVNYIDKVNRSKGPTNDINHSNNLFKEFIWPYKDVSKLFNCSILNQVKKFKYLTSGWTKSVFSFDYDGQSFALKTVNMNGNDLKSCMQTNIMKACYEKASSKMYKEYILSRELSHRNVVKVLGWCVGNDNQLENVAIISELCSPIDTISLLQMTFQQRLHIIYNVIVLINFLSSSTLGSIAINDFRSEQFVLCDGTPKLTDLDDLSIEEPHCKSDEQCSLSDISKHLKLPKSYVGSNEVECVDFVCAGYNEKKNVMNVYRHFINLFLTIAMPDYLKEDMELFMQNNAPKKSAKLLLEEIEYIYKRLNNSD